MLTSTLSFRLVLWLGQTVPLPAPPDVQNALTSLEVTNDEQSGDGFRMSFTLSKELPFDFNLLQSGALKPSTRVIIGVLLGASLEILIDGIITHHQVAPSDEPGASTLTVMGKDVSIMLDLEEKNDKFENQPDSVIVTRLLGNYAQYGLVPEVTVTTDVPLEIDRVPQQHETDLQFIRRMAERNGFVFYIEPLPAGFNTAYWGKKKRIGVPQHSLTMGMGTHSNLSSLSFTQDSLAPVQTKGVFLLAGQEIPIPPLPPLRVPPLATTPTPALRTVLMRDTANESALQAVLSALSAALNQPDSVTGNGEINTLRYGHVLRARNLVGIRGAGLSYDGFYYVTRVTHNITRGDYKQSFTVSREGTGALLPVVIP